MCLVRLVVVFIFSHHKCMPRWTLHWRRLKDCKSASKPTTQSQTRPSFCTNPQAHRGSRHRRWLISAGRFLKFKSGSTERRSCCLSLIELHVWVARACAFPFVGHVIVCWLIRNHRCIWRILQKMCVCRADYYMTTLNLTLSHPRSLLTLLSAFSSWWDQC